MSKRTIIAPLVVCFICWLTGCSGGSGDPSVVNRTEAGVVERTFVRLSPDGTKTVRSAVVSREQSRAQLAARVERLAHQAQAAAEGLGVAEQAVTGNEGPDDCPPIALWIFDSSYSYLDDNVYWVYQGFGGVDHELCVEGNGDLDLTTQEHSYYGTHTVYWNGNIRSYYPGSCGGGYDGLFFACSVGFDAGTTYVDVGSSSCVNHSTNLLMYPTGC
jgi:hypothetical protein